MSVLRGDGTTEQATVYLTILMNTSDTPARIKVDGTAAVTSEKHPCFLCDIKSFSLADEDAFDPTSKWLVESTSFAH